LFKIDRLRHSPALRWVDEADLVASLFYPSAKSQKDEQKQGSLALRAGIEPAFAA